MDVVVVSVLYTCICANSIHVLIVYFYFCRSEHGVIDKGYGEGDLEAN